MGGIRGLTLKMTIFGESHGPAVGIVLDGLPPGLAVDREKIARDMARRAPGRSRLSTRRREEDDFLVQSGVYEGHTTGTPLCVLIPNRDQHSDDYKELRHAVRPGHADYTVSVRSGGWADLRGGGHSSGRLTAPLVWAGSLARSWLEERGISLAAHILSVGGTKDRSFDPAGEPEEVLRALPEKAFPVLEEEKGQVMEEQILRTAEQKDSLGGIVECMMQGLPAGLGDPFFDSVESRISAMLFSIPAVKGVEFGSGFAMTRMKGSEANDPFRMEDGQIFTASNHNGGILGGMTTGMPLLFRAAVKPTPSIGRMQKTVDIEKKINTDMVIHGRHDPCIVPRAVPVIEAAAAWTLMDLWLTDRGTQA